MKSRGDTESSPRKKSPELKGSRLQYPSKTKIKATKGGEGKKENMRTCKKKR